MKVRRTIGGALFGIGCAVTFVGILATVLPMVQNDQLQLVLSSFEMPSGNLIVSAIMMGANIDYAIVISSWYNELKATMPRKQAIVKALSLAFPTVLTSGSILSVAAFLIAQITTEPSIVGIGQCLCRGTLISMFLVMFILPQILFLGDGIVERTRFNLKFPEHELITRTSGVIYVSGRVRGRVSGVIDANIHGVIHGELAAMVDSGDISKEEEHETQE